MSDSVTLTLGQATIYTADTGLPDTWIEAPRPAWYMLDAINTTQ